ncbi:hypothetical protein SEVIR_7G281501v4 [Setaria viridis]|uniref:YTH domain-containing family protein n=1 Tax=Setaria viridis TaxID=4556 RepID=A0A4U6U0R3_SETVI|nr:uncharacterized protein LOC117862772 [Setaria viridis]TKW07042.1 hypothetical protein SEVIR_7G281501v2 [Setaria viridis]TKW07043.1 hypothetical protein SEVIR_7G281501v2 [Setaria viridis]
MDLQEHHELIFGEEFCFPATTTYYPPLYGPTGINVPAQLYQHQTISRCDNRAPNYAGHQAQGTSYMYYVIPEYGIAHSPHGPHLLHPCAIGDGSSVRTQEYRAETVEHTYHQPVPTPHYPALPSAVDRTPATTAQSLAYTNGLFVPGGLKQTVAVASESGVAWNQSVQQATISSMGFQGHTFLPKEQPRWPAPWKRQFSGGAMVPARLPRARRASQQSTQVAVPSVRSSLQTNLSYNNEVSNVGSDRCKMLSAERSQPYARTISYANRRLSSVSQQNISKAKMPIGSLSSEIIGKSYTSRLLIGNPEGRIIISTDQYNRDDFQVVYTNAKFFVIKSYNEADIHKSIKYGVWSTSSVGNLKLDTAFRDAQVIAASSSTLCPVLLFFSVNGSSHFCGVAEMVGPVDYQNDMDFWCRKNKWIGSFPVKWHIIKNVHNSTFRSILLQNNEDKPVTSSRDTQEIHYTPGTTMLELFKYTRAEGCVLDDFMVHEEEEARSGQLERFKLRQGAPHFIPAWHGPCTKRPMLPKSDSVLKDRIVSETNNLTDKLQNLNLDGHQSSCQEFGNRTSEASTTNTQKGSHYYGDQVLDNPVKVIASDVKFALDGERRRWKKVETTPTEKPQPETVARVSSKAPPRKHRKEGKNTLVHSASGAPEMTCEEQKIVGKPCSPAFGSTPSQACSKPVPGVVAIGSMLIPITTSI